VHVAFCVAFFAVWQRYASDRVTPSAAPPPMPSAAKPTLASTSDEAGTKLDAPKAPEFPPKAAHRTAIDWRL
jgi:hypothetical protein